MNVARIGLALVVMFLLAGCAADSQNREASEIHTQLGINYLQRGDLNQAQESLDKALSSNSANAEAHSAMAVLSERLGEYDEASHHFRRSLSLDGDQPSVRNNFGSFLCSRGRYEEADEQFQQAIDNPLYERSYVALANAGQCALRDERRDDAEEAFRRALEERPEFPVALRRMARLQLEKGDAEAAQRYYQRFAQHGEQDAATLLLGFRIAEAMDDKNAAASYALRLRSQYPDSEQAQTVGRLRQDD